MKQLGLCCGGEKHRPPSISSQYFQRYRGLFPVLQALWPHLSSLACLLPFVLLEGSMKVTAVKSSRDQSWVMVSVTQHAAGTTNTMQCMVPWSMSLYLSTVEITHLSAKVRTLSFPVYLSCQTHGGWTLFAFQCGVIQESNKKQNQTNSCEMKHFIQKLSITPPSYSST